MISWIKNALQSIEGGKFAPTTSVGSVFQISGAATLRARLPTVDSLTGGTTRRLALVERSVRRPGKSSTQPACSDFIPNPQPVQTDESIRSVVTGHQAVDQSSCRVQDRVESTRQVSRKADQHAVPIVQPGVHQCNHEHLKCGRRHTATHLT